MEYYSNNCLKGVRYVIQIKIYMLSRKFICFKFVPKFSLKYLKISQDFIRSWCPSPRRESMNLLRETIVTNLEKLLEKFDFLPEMYFSAFRKILNQK